MPKENKQLGQKIKAARLSKQLSLRGLARSVRVSHQFIMYVERGDCDIGASILKRIADVLGVAVADFF